MYCSGCGNEIKSGLNYCSRCGARVDKIEKSGGDNSGAVPYLSITTGFVALGGLGLTFGLIALLLDRNVLPPVVVILALAFLCAVFGISFMLIQQISRMTKSASNDKNLDTPNLVQLGAINTAQLEEYRQPAASVTENTTRTFDKIPLRKN